MSFRTRRFVALAGPLLLAVPAAANQDLLGLGPDRLAKIASAPGDKGVGSGMIQMPRTDRLGRLHATFDGGQGKSRYVLDADLTLFLPASPGELPRQQVGGVYGTIFRVLDDKGSTRPVGTVEGLWTLELNMSGELDALVWHRNDAGAFAVGGLIEASFRVHDSGLREQAADVEIWVGGPPLQAPPRAAARMGLGERDYRSSSSAPSSVQAVPVSPDRSFDLDRAGNVNVLGAPVQVGGGRGVAFIAAPAGPQQQVVGQPAPAQLGMRTTSSGGAGGMNLARRQRQKPARSTNPTSPSGPSFVATGASAQRAATRVQVGSKNMDPVLTQQGPGGGGGSAIGDRGSSLGAVGANVGNAQIVLGGGGGAPIGFRAVGVPGGAQAGRQAAAGTRSGDRMSDGFAGLRPAHRQRVDPATGETIQSMLVGPAFLRFKLID